MINQFLNKSCSCKDALVFFFGFNELETGLYLYLVQEDNKTVAELIPIFSRNQSTIYTALERLVSQKVVSKIKRARETRGYEYLYSATPPKEVKSILKTRLDTLYEQMSNCLKSFDNEALTLNIFSS